MFRKHQDQFGEICYSIRTGRSPRLKTIICSTTPGGGKSMLPIIAASQLIGTVADRICWVVPRKSLQKQAEEEFLKPAVRDMLGHSHTIRRSTNEPDPCRGLSGFATTYQAIGMGNYFLQEEFSRRRYILVLDEPHHIEEGGAWEAALAPLVQRAALTVYMSGTLERGNRKRIAFLPYRETKDGEVVDLSESEFCASIHYSRQDALLEKAILPIHFELMDGTAEWIGRDGKSYGTKLSVAHKDTAEALYTALKTQFAEQLLDECSGHWSQYRLTHPRSKLLVVTAGIEDARKYVKHLHKQGIKAAIATSDDSAQAAANIEHYKTVGKRTSLDALVTVAMAYEGLDVPAVTHIACLTHIRSRPWIEQMIARATRFDGQAGPWEEQMAFVYVPDDSYMCSIIQRMKDDQITAIKKAKDEEELAKMMLARADATPSEERNSIVPVGSSGGPRRWSRVGPPTQQAASDTPRVAGKTPSQQEAELRDQIQAYCRQVDNLYF
ncbi:MAG TPA: DEAD/DEAH box helicase family protein, partial [Abditibacteriaceae bacterium]